jgi:hypothetical protein
MKHEEVRHKLSEFIDGAVTPGEKSAIEQHLKTCAECSDALRELRKAIEHIHAIEEVDSPAWMTQKIMAKVRTEAENKKGIWQRVFAPFLTKFPVQAVAVLFLAVTAYYIYSSINPAQKYTEEPVGMPAKKEAPAVGRMKEEDDVVREAAPESKEAARKPGYKSLDMKYAYEKPAAPVPREQPVASAPAPAKQETQMYAQDKTDLERRSVSPKAKAEAPSLMAEQPAPAAGAAQQPVAREAISPERRNAKDALSLDKAEAEARIAVTEHFVNFDLPAKQKVKGLSFVVRIFQTDDTDLQWMQKTSAYQSRPCTSKYVVDMELSGSLSKYLYCYDHSHVKLLGVFGFKNGSWSEIK